MFLDLTISMGSMNFRYLTTLRNKPIRAGTAIGKRRLIPLLIAFCLLGQWRVCLAGENQDQFRLSGFATIGFSKSSDSDLGHRRYVDQEGHFADAWTPKTDSLLGLQIDAAISNAVSATLQLVGRERAQNTLEDSIEWAYFRYRFNDKLSFRAGRISNDLFMLSDYRNIGFAYLWVRPPMEFYAPIGYEHIAGGDARYAQKLGRGIFSIKIFAGNSESKFEFDGESRSFDVNNVQGFNLAWESDTWRIRYGLFSLDFDNSINGAFSTKQFRSALLQAVPFGWAEAEQIASDITADNNGITYNALGVSFDHYPWLLQAEINYYQSDYDLLKDYSGKYLSLGYRVGDLTFYTINSRGSPEEAATQVAELPPPLAQVPQFIQLQQAVQTLYDSTLLDQETWAIGARWNLSYNAAMKIQWDKTRVQPEGTVLWKVKEPISKERDIDIFSLTFDFVF